MALSSAALGGSTARSVVAEQLTRRERDVKGSVFALLLLLATVSTLVIIASLLAQVFGEAGPYLADREIGRAHV